MDSILSRLVQVGVVTDNNLKERKVRVRFADSGMTSGWLTVLQRKETANTEFDSDTQTWIYSNSEPCTKWWVPRINDVVLVLYLPIDNSDGYVLGGV